jgi:hypothetical protein
MSELDSAQLYMILASSYNVSVFNYPASDLQNET